MQGDRFPQLTLGSSVSHPLKHLLEFAFATMTFGLLTGEFARH